MDNQNTVSSKTYIFVFIGLVVLTLISSGLSSLNLGYLNPLIAIGLAVISAGVVLNKFMNIKLDGSFARLLIAGVLVLALLIFFVGFVG
ncbi:cytochrome C oxidase subunit IV family protein [Carboxylicivirga sp. RSCT41]|uniref:cytochrome C oxidase subunit IV family protein n=1 Tax=Carboxylicivirga agarovorans TaxID=3417570 RepID=UPI003D32B6DB